MREKKSQSYFGRRLVCQQSGRILFPLLLVLKFGRTLQAPRELKNQKPKLMHEPLPLEILIQSAWRSAWVLGGCRSSPGDSNVLQSLRTHPPPQPIDKILM